MSRILVEGRRATYGVFADDVICVAIEHHRRCEGFSFEWCIALNAGNTHCGEDLFALVVRSGSGRVRSAHIRFRDELTAVRESLDDAVVFRRDSFGVHGEPLPEFALLDGEELLILAHSVLRFGVRGRGQWVTYRRSDHGSEAKQA